MKAKDKEHSLPDTRPMKVVEYDPDDLLELSNDAVDAALEKSGGARFLKLAQGETRIYIEKQRVRVAVNAYGAEQALFRVFTAADTKAEKKWDLAFKLASPMVAKLIPFCKTGGEVTVVRVGEGKDTKYALKL